MPAEAFANGVRRVGAGAINAISRLGFAARFFGVVLIHSPAALKRIRAIREERYSLFRGFFHGASDAADAAENLQPRLHSLLLSGRARAIGRSLAELDVAGLVEITGVRRKGARSHAPGPGFVFEEGDVVVLLGRPENLALAEQKLLKR